MGDRTGVRRRLDLHNISIDFAFHACRTMRFHPSRHRPGLLATAPAPRPLSRRTAHASPPSARPVPCSASQPLPRFRR